MGILIRALFLLGPLALASCYEPQLRACSVACDEAVGCPGSLVCGAASMCVFDVADTCESDPGGVDAGTADADDLDAALPVTVQIVAYGGGRVIDSANGIDCGTSCAYQLASGTDLVLTPVPDSSRRFDKWTDEPCKGNASDCSLTLGDDATLKATAKFRKDD